MRQEERNTNSADDLAARLANPSRIASLALPPFNSFIADQFALKNPQHTEADIEAKKEYAPTRIGIESLVDDASAKSDFVPLSAHPLSQVYWKADRTFHLPKSNILLRFLTPIAYSEPRHVMLASLFAQILQDALNEFAYNAEQAGLSYKSAHTRTRSAHAFASLFSPRRSFSPRRHLCCRLLADVFVSIVLPSLVELPPS